MQEWSKRNELNSFNSYKGLLYSNWYQAIRDWKDHKRDAPLPPVEASLDPIHACNLQCEHCNAASYLVYRAKEKMMKPTHLLELVSFLGRWGVKAVCFGGGGEPTLHPTLAEAFETCKLAGMDASIATNGTLFNQKLIETMSRTCRWVGVSIDSATANIYVIGRKANLFDQAISNMKNLIKQIKKDKSICEVAYKFLIFDYNQHEIFDACKLAKDIGVRDFHVRPADFSHQGMGKNKQKHNPYDINKIQEQFEKCHELETERFRVFTVIHKFKPDFTPDRNFSQCYASPCSIQLCADGNVYLCPDQRHSQFYLLGNHYPNPNQILNFWGKIKHYNLVFKTGAENCKTRCTFSPYCRQCEELFIKDTDPMCKWFI
jgi:MoaA/NifB/PqqE/SkfB family radical SAM enzyme